MSVLVDTTVWSLALRRRQHQLSTEERGLAGELNRLMDERRVRIIGPIRQEVLSGIPDEGLYEGLRTQLRDFEDEPLNTGDFESAAQLYNRCRAAGVAGSDVDLLICAIALDRRWSIFSTDQDFVRYEKIIGVELYSPRKANPLN